MEYLLSPTAQIKSSLTQDQGHFKMTKVESKKF